jgi:membrane-associated phospholipid phosphatase
MNKLRLGFGVWSLVAAPLSAQMDTLNTQRRRTVDEWMAQAVRRPAWVRTGIGHHAANVVSFVGATAPLTVSLVAWGSRGSFGPPELASHGRVATGALMSSWAATGALKIAFGRARPYVTADSNSRDFEFGRGFGRDGYRALPSGHATMAFTMAAMLSEDHARRRGRSASYDAAVYSGAALVGLSRMALDKHWVTDVLLGAGIGIVAGKIAWRSAP